jgi:hypothetical protein
MTDDSQTAVRRTLQFDLQALLWLVVTIGLCLAFLRGYGGRVVTQGVAVIACAVGLGVGVGWYRRSSVDVVYWSVMGAVVAFMSVTGVTLPHWSAWYFWIITGMFTGAVIALVADDHPRTTIAAGIATSTIIIFVHALLVYQDTGEVLVYDVICAALAGGIFAEIVVICRWLEKKQVLRRDTSAAILTLLVLAANCVDRHWAP